MVRSCEDEKLDVILQRQKETSSLRLTQVLNNLKIQKLWQMYY